MATLNFRISKWQHGAETAFLEVKKYKEI